MLPRLRSAAKLGGPKPLNPAHLDRARNQQIEAHTALDRQRNQDDRAGALNQRRRRL
jgi:hypothetical protein